MPESNGKAEYLVGVDLGGTKILAGVFDDTLDCIATSKFSTKHERGRDKVIERIAQCVQFVIDEADLSLKQVRGVGVGAPGGVDYDSGTVIFAPNLDGWKDVPLKKELEKILGVPVFVQNDANVAMLGVYVAELKSKPRDVVGLFLGTGIGGGLILNGELYSGFGHMAGEIGHMVIDINGPKCGCGNRGCFEALASRTAIVQRIKDGINEGEKTPLSDLPADELAGLRSNDLRKAIRRGDKFVTKVVERAAEHIGIGIANLVNILSPEAVVLGGGMMEALADEILPTIVKSAKEHAFPGAMKDVEIVASKLGDNAGITGAAVLARRGTK